MLQTEDGERRLNAAGLIPKVQIEDKEQEMMVLDILSIAEVDRDFVTMP